MEPVFTEAWSLGAQPLIDGRIEVETAFDQAMAPFRVFMAARIEPETFQTLAALREATAAAAEPVDLRTLLRGGS